MKSTNKIIGRLGPIIGIIVVAFVISPLIVVVLISLTAGDYISFPWDQGWSFRWFAELPSQDEFIRALLNSLGMAVVSALIAIAVGVPASIAIVRFEFPGRSILTLLGTAPLFVPMLLSGLALLLTFGVWGVPPGPVGLVLGFGVVTLPFVLRISIATLQDFNLDQEYAAENLGATKLQAFFKVTLPQIRAGIVSAGVLAFIVAFDAVALAIFFVSPNFELLPVKLFFYSLTNFDPLAASIATTMIALSLVLVVIIESTFGLEKLFGGGRSSLN